MTEVNLTVCRVITLHDLFLLFSGKNCLLLSVSLCLHSTIRSVQKISLGYFRSRNSIDGLSSIKTARRNEAAV